MYDEHVPTGMYKKLHHYYRPVEIFEILPHNCYKVKDLKTSRIMPIKIHANRLKPDPSSFPTSPCDEQTDILTAAQPTPEMSDWHAIDCIVSRRRTADGIFLYKVLWANSDTYEWLPACDITNAALDAFYHRLRKHRRH